MKLRDHPLLIRKSGVVSWPPQWTPVGLNRGVIKGELGILDDVGMNALIPNKIFISMQHLAERYIAVLAFDDETFAQQLHLILAQNIGRSTREIGELDLSHLL